MALTAKEKQELLDILARTGGHREAWQINREVPDWYLACQEQVTRETVTIPVPAVGVPVTCYISTAKNRVEHCPVHVNFHGGGFIFPQNEDDDRYCARLAAQLGGVVVDVDYASSQEHPFPAAFEQSYEVMKWVFAHCAQWGGDPGKVSMGGHSAGGTLTGAVNLRAAQTGDFRVCLQILDYAASDNNLPFAGQEEGKTELTLERSGALSLFYVDGNRELLQDPYASPAYAPDQWLKGLPPTVFIHAGNCPFTEVNLKLAERMVRAGVEVTQRMYPDSRHAFTVRLLDQWQEAQDFILEQLKKAAL